MPFDPQTQLILIYVGLFLLLWISICWIISRLGWKQLTHRYTAHSPPKGARFSFQSATIGRFGKYNHCLTIHVCIDGLHLAIFPLFRISHPPLFFRWSDIRLLKQHKNLFGTRFIYDLGFPRVRRIALSEGVHQEIQYYQTGGT